MTDHDHAFSAWLLSRLYKWLRLAYLVQKGTGNMTTVQTRVREISNREGFEIIVIRRSTGKPVDVRKNGTLDHAWPFHRKTKDSATVADFRAKFETEFPGFSCIVEEGDGSSATGQKTLGAVRATY